MRHRLRALRCGLAVLAARHRRGSLRLRLGWAWAIVGWALWATPAAADSPLIEKAMEIDRVKQSYTLTFDATDFGNRDLEDKLRTGLPQTLVVQGYLYRKTGGDPLAVTAQSCRVVYDLWQGTYRVDVQRPGSSRSVELTKPQQVLRACLRLERLPFADDAADHLKGASVYCAVLVELNPISQATLERIRHWLSRPSAGGPLRGDAFFGSFVSIFVGRDIGRAERSRAYRSPTWIVQ